MNTHTRRTSDRRTPAHILAAAQAGAAALRSGASVADAVAVVVGGVK
jgi:hypothetical protein